MNLDHYRQLLNTKQDELLADLAQAKAQAKEASEPDVQDETDLAVRTQEQEDLMDDSTRDSELLQEVRDALKRIDNGSYGKCLVCGRPIEEKRLNAVPWAQYDLQHQAEMDKHQGKPTGGSTL